MVDPDKARQQVTQIDRGPLGDARPDNTTADTRANPDRPQEKVEDRENVSIVTPENYPLADRKLSRPK